MYLQNKVQGDALAGTAQLPRPLGPAFPAEKVVQADEMFIWASSLTDPFECTRFDLMRHGKVIATVLLPGY